MGNLPVFEALKNLKVDDNWVAETELKRKEEARAERKRRLEDNYRSIAPARYLDESLETYKPTEENRKSFEWLLKYCQTVEKGENTKNLLYLNGKSGTGKTHLALGVLKRLGGFFITSLEMCITYDSCRDFRASMTRIEWLERLVGHHLLIIDEVGKGLERIEREILPYIVNVFYNDQKKILIMTGNETAENFRGIIGESGADRFCESGVMLPLCGDSYRKGKLSQK